METKTQELFEEAYNHFRKKRYQKSLSLFEQILRSHDHQHRFALYYAGYLHLYHHNDKDSPTSHHKLALAYFKRALRLGQHSAALQLGYMYALGLGLENPNFNIAITYYEWAAQKEQSGIATLNAGLLRAKVAQSDDQLVEARQLVYQAIQMGGVSDCVSSRKMDAYLKMLSGLRTLNVIRSTLLQKTQLDVLDNLNANKYTNMHNNENDGKEHQNNENNTDENDENNTNKNDETNQDGVETVEIRIEQDEENEVHSEDLSTTFDSDYDD